MISSASRWHLISLPVSLITRIPGPPLGGFLLRAVLTFFASLFGHGRGRAVCSVGQVV